MEQTHSASFPAAPGNWRRGFWSLIVTQFQGAFSDNALKNLVTVLVLSMGLPPAMRDRLVPEVGAIFSVPFILFSMYGGFFADRFSKRTISISIKVFEIAIMLAATAGLFFSAPALLLTAVFLMGVHSAIFGPSKYGLLPELLPREKLSWGNGVIELGTFLAIILGTATGPLLAQYFHGRQYWSGALLVMLAFAGLGTSFGITRVPAANPARKFHFNFVADLWREIQYARQDRLLWLAIMSNTYFFFLGTLLQLNIFILGTDVLHLDESHIGYLLVALALGMGLGSIAAGYLSGNKIEYGLVPLGAIGMTVFSAVLFLHGLAFVQVVALLSALGFFGGFFIVPVSAVMQHRPSEERKGSLLAAANLLSFVGVFLASGCYYALSSGAAIPHTGLKLLHLSPAAIFLVGGLLTLAATVYSLMLLPQALVRLLLWMVTRTVYRIRVEGMENVPSKGGALFVSNHLSFMDALLLVASTDRFVRFIMFKDIYDLPMIKPLARLGDAIPISSQLRPREMIRALRTASEAIQQGQIVCIFAEGQITRIGQMLPFRRGMERIMKNVDAPIIPVHLDGVWGSIFSFERGRFVWKIPHEIPYHVTVSFGKPLPPDTPPFEVRRAVQELHTQAYDLRRKRIEPLHHSFVRVARKHRRRFAMADGQTAKVSFGSALTRTIFLARRLRHVWKDQKMVGILLPPSVPGALVNQAALLTGKVPVNLNYTASDAVVASCAQQCELKTIISAKAFLEKIPVHPPEKVILLEELAANPRLSEKIIALALSWLAPRPLLERYLSGGKTARIDDLATVIFSSGSTGDPKGVLLTHYNIASNIQQMGQVFALDKHDRVLGILPFFHSFGFTVTICLPTVLGVGVVFHPNPLDARVIGALAQKYAITFMVATPTFLQTYVRRCAPEDFGSVQFVLAGAEKLPERIVQAFEDQFGIRPLEGYGCTECSPVVAVNTRDFRAAGFRQVGAKRGKIGHPLPGMSVRIVNPETGEPQPLGQQGLLLVKGPNVMQGYLNRPEKTAEVLRDGWYNTGDIAILDEDGFLAIADRLSRFSKIGGEMVPHVKVEERLHELADATEQKFAVTAVPDEKKGERLIVLHTLTDAQLKDCLEKFAACDLPALWKPRANQFFHVEALPYLGTGKLDLRRIKELAAELSTKEPQTA
ncbi:MAG TPA: acyl-[ACP]--phospholipid O-acyltransferase [Terriglobales bacterium]|jgi:acyl-[acyl-carrier-protein]-phospholipid O-acyltransferase/long-chain-fatty-acid--[acyl-carrier-protein] ligase|nr:acyl-[ACP]--phospholipid O-acyltransferase [Terriglobales bacterium]